MDHCTFFHTRLPNELIDFFSEHGSLYNFKKKTVMPATLANNNLFMLKSGLASIAHYVNFGSKCKLSMYVAPYRLVDIQRVCIKSGDTGCKAIEINRDSELLGVSFEAAQNLIYTNPSLHFALLRECGINYRRDIHLPIFLLSANPEKKTIRFMHDMILALGEDISAKWVKLPLKLTREEYTSTLYISMIKFDLLLNKWNKEGLIKRESGHLVINTLLFCDMEKCVMESMYADKCYILKKS